MPPSDEQEPLGGLARSIDDLFSAAEEDVAEGAREDVAEGAPEDVGEGAPEDAESPPDPVPRTSGRRAPGQVREADPLMDMEVLPVEDEPAGTGGSPEQEAPPFEGIDLEDEGDWSGDIYDVPAPPPADQAFAEFDGPAGAMSGPGPASGGTGAGSSEVEPADAGAALEAAVERYLAGGGALRDELSRRIRERAAELRDGNRTEPVADAVERLVVAARRHGEQEAPLALARLMASPSVATLLTVRLGTARDDERRRQLVEVAKAVGSEMAPALGEALSGTDDRSARRAYMDALVSLGEDAMPVVARMVEDSRWFVVRNAVLILGEIGGETSVHHLTTTLGHEDPRVRRETLLALAKIGGTNACALVQNKLDDPDPQVRAASARAMGELEIERGVRALLARLDEESDQEVQVAILRALGQLGDPGAVPSLEKRAVGGFFSRPPTEIRVAAYRALGAIGTPHARKLLEDAADDGDAAVKAAAAAALTRSD